MPKAAKDFRQKAYLRLEQALPTRIVALPQPPICMPTPQYHIVPGGPRRFDLPPPARQAPAYWQSATYDYPWLASPEAEVGRCAFDGDGYMELTTDRLVVFEDWRRHEFALRRVRSVRIGFKRLAGPLVIGGIVAPLSFVASFGQVFNFWVGMACFVLGLMLFYYGIQGSHQVVVGLDGHDFQFFIDEKTAEVEAFVRQADRAALGRAARRARPRRPSGGASITP
jgi:hypothetical protein